MRRAFAIVSLVFLVLAAFSLAGCASIQPMALSAKTKTLDLSEASVALMTLKISNEYKPGFQPRTGFAAGLFVHKTDQKTGKRQAFEVGKPYHYVAKQYNEYLVSMKVDPGEHKLTTITGASGYFPIAASFQIPIYDSFDVQLDKVVYLGHIEAVNRKRISDDELRAGSIIPLIDQAVSGFSGGTWHIKIFDNYENDIAAFKQKYPLINNYTVEKMVLSPWEKPSSEELK